ncbi:LacI family DNA-binding transcriptional regulator [Alkalihalobacillus hwajinpoensis]|uniref:LacI family DNA-binding transcriptional regulator n=1 Tax=Guptibacillus hwajinpoensis TaxID=208199 RepID=UPI00188331B5|nr:LacI family DNA-binding transcriptional regulator [Pseudalkalibacillus hwajinpoensis]MBF0705058.1 LacI family DNA-binding transcriptional regulator [Pseudalkalibacillus hwajinpoensis]
MPTIKDVAKRAGVSRTTVSRVLNDNGYVSHEARQRVVEAVEEMGYIPSAHAKTMRTKRSGVIGVILPRISTETASRVVNGIENELAANGYQILLTNTQLQPEKEIQNIKLLKSRQVDGIILLATNRNQELLDTISDASIPFVAIGQELNGVMSVVYDDYHSSYSVTESLIEKGHRHIGFIGVPETDHAVGIVRKQGYLDAMKKHGLTVEKGWIQYGNFTFESGYEAAKQLVEQSELKPTAIFAVTDRMAIGALGLLKEQGIRIPEDMALFGIGASDLSRHVTPALSTVDYFNEDAGQKTAQLILEQLSGKVLEKKKLKLNYRLIERDSV